MPKVTYTDQTEAPKFELLPEGEYIFQVLAAGDGIQQAGKTRGCEYLELKLGIERAGEVVTRITQKLIFAESLQWFIDSFIKATNIAPGISRGASVDLNKDSVVGLRGWAYVIQESFDSNREVDPDTGRPKRMVTNRIKYWLCDKEPLAPVDFPHEDEDDCPF